MQDKDIALRGNSRGSALHRWSAHGSRTRRWKGFKIEIEYIERASFGAGVFFPPLI